MNSSRPAAAPGARAVVYALALALGLASAAPASALDLTGSFQGHVIGQDGALTLFGPGSLAGEAYTATWSYSLAGYSLSSGDTFSIGRVAGGVDISLTIRGITFNSISDASTPSTAVIHGNSLWVASRDYCGDCSAVRLVMFSSVLTDHTLYSAADFNASLLTGAVFNYAFDGSPGMGDLSLGIDSVAVPEPASIALLAASCAGLVGIRRRTHA